MYFEWDKLKDAINEVKHGVSFSLAQFAFADPDLVIAEDLEHSFSDERRYFGFGKVNDEIITVRFTMREGKIRIIGAGYWRKGKKIYEEKTRKIH